MLQITAAIKVRKFFEDRDEKQKISWAVRTLATMIAGGYMTDGKKGNPALDMAMKLAIDEIDSALLEDAQTRGNVKKIKEPEIGSYERIMGAFGGKLSAGPKPEGG